MTTELEFMGRVAFITGGASGIGRAAALAFARKGAAVHLTDLNEEGLQETAAAIAAEGGSASYSCLDVTDEAAVAGAIETVLAEQGQLDFALNSAGIGGTQALTAEYPAETFARVMAVNVTGVYYCMKHELAAMAAQGRGSIVNIASVAGLVGFPRHSAYAASKHAVIGLTKSAALEYVRQGVRVNAVCPGFTDTPMVDELKALGAEYTERLLRGIPARRLGRPEEIAAAIIYLCTDDAGFMTGQALTLDGGITAG
ncbi:MAG: SDR family oxidoreductase [Anaerolineales bacterium]|nr:SDR family oxidoreductase [Anaerolineales bacterium]